MQDERTPAVVQAIYDLSVFEPGNALAVVRAVPPGPPVDDDELRALRSIADRAARDPLTDGQPPDWKWNVANSVVVFDRLLTDRAAVAVLDLCLYVDRMLRARAWHLEHLGVDRGASIRARALDAVLRQIGAADLADWERELVERPTGPAFYTTVGDRLRRMRVAAAYTQAQVATFLGVDRSTVVRWESNERAPHRSHRVALAELLGGRPGDYDAAPA
jgi:DNA-binding XRE family transcriptional regulator